MSGVAWAMPQVGERYVVESRPNPEYHCESCGYVIDAESGANGQVVTVIPWPEGWRVVCPVCMTDYPHDLSGHVAIQYSDGYKTAIPYTWLVPLYPAGRLALAAGREGPQEAGA